MTLRYLNGIINEWWASHAQINHVYIGSQEEYLTIPNKQYVGVCVEYLQSNFQAKNIVHQYRFTISDLFNPNIENHNANIYSSLLQIVEDFDMWLRTSEEYTIQNNLSVIPFDDDSNDRTSGYIFNVNVQIPRVINECQKPVRVDITAPEL